MRFKYIPACPYSNGRTKYSLRDVDVDDAASPQSSSKNESDDETSSELSEDYALIEQRYPHPLGFRNLTVMYPDDRLGRTRFSLLEEDPEDEKQFIHSVRSKERCKQPCHSLRPNEELQKNRASLLPITGLTRHTVGSSNPTAVILHHALSRRCHSEVGGDSFNAMNNPSMSSLSEMDRISAQLESAVTFSSSDCSLVVDLSPFMMPTKLPVLNDIADITHRAQLKTNQMMEKERQKARRDHMECAEALLLLLQQDEQDARLIDEKEKKQEAAHARIASDKKIEIERRDAIEREEAAKIFQQEDKKRIENLQKRDEEKEDEARRRSNEEKERGAITRAHKMVAQLKQLRATIEPFESSKMQPIPQRRLGYKKLIKGKMNTLTHEHEKVRSIASEIIDAIHHAKQEDEQLKVKAQQLGAPELSFGRRYLMDLLACNVIVRVQSEQFSSSRGDEFPLACTVALVAADIKEFSVLMAAHVFSVCPMAIPKLPEANTYMNQTELMQQLGMIRDSDGEYESYDRFVSRTEGLISLTAAIMSSDPDGQSILGHPIKWLVRFLSALPTSPSQLPIITAPVLVSFLTAAGTMLARKYPTEFKQLLNQILSDVVPRVDNGSLGAPSLVRLKKTLQGGFEQFEALLPRGAIPELYVSNDAFSRPEGTKSGSLVNRVCMTYPSSSTSQEPTNPFLTHAASINSSSTNSENKLGLNSSKLITSGNTSGNIIGKSSSVAASGVNIFDGNGALKQEIDVTSPFGLVPNSLHATNGNENGFNGNSQSAVSSSPFGTVSKQPQNPFISSQLANINPFGSSLNVQNVSRSPFGFSFQQGSNFLNGGSSSNPFSNNDKLGKNKDSAPLCKFFSQGKCRNGEFCKFLHKS